MAVQDESRWGLWALAGWAAAITVLAVVAELILRRERRRRVVEKERSPLKEKLLRPAGFSLQERISHLTDRLYEAFLWELFCMGVFAVGVAWFVAGIRQHWISIAILAVPPLAGLGAGVFFFRRILSFRREIRNCRLGWLGEQAVAEALNDPAVTNAGYRSFHDVPGDGDWNIDHVVVGPAGVFVLEAKTRPRKKAKIQQDENVVDFDGRMLRFPWCKDGDAAQQAERNARSLWKVIKGYSPEGVTVQPIVVVPGWFVKSLATTR